MEPGGADWETVFGFPTDALENILSPGRSYHKKRFELGLEPLTYLGYPVYIREDGYWRKRREKSKKKEDGIEALDWEIGSEGVLASITKQEPMSPDAGRATSNVPEVKPVVKDGSGEVDEDSKSTTSEDDRKAMSMFNVVFVMNPPLLEHNLRIKEMFECVVKKFAKVLKYEQARSNWVWKQSELILNMKEKAKEDGMPYCS